MAHPFSGATASATTPGHAQLKIHSHHQLPRRRRSGRCHRGWRGTASRDTIWEQSRFIASDQTLRNFVLNEPRGGVFRHVNLLVPPKHPEAQMGFIIMEPEDTPPMSGSNCICVATVLLDTGIIPMVEPVTHLKLEAPAGLVEITAQCNNGKANRITLRNVPSFADRLQVPLEVEGHGTILVDTAFGGDSFVLAEAKSFGFEMLPDEAREIAVMGRKIAAAANAQLGFSHPTLPDWNHFSFCFMTGPLERVDGTLSSRNACVVKPGKLDRSPTGTGCSALMAVLHAKGLMKTGDTLHRPLHHRKPLCWEN